MSHKSNFLASTLKIDLLKTISEPKLEKRLKLAEIEDLCYIMAILMHKEVTEVRFPDVKVAWCCNVVNRLQQLLEVIGAECPKLTSLVLRTSCKTPVVMTQNSELAVAIFKVLPRLVNLKKLQINYFTCDDWALQQIGEHATNLV
jgi:hypothetical protein